MRADANDKINIDQKVSVLIVDDSEVDRITTRNEIQKLCVEIGGTSNIRECSALDQALRILSEQTFHVLLLDKDLGTDEMGTKIDGVQAIPEIKRLQPHIQIFMLTGYEDVPSAVTAMEFGASDYLLKKADSAYSSYRNKKIRQALVHAWKSLKDLRTQVGQQLTTSAYIAKSPAMQRLDTQLKYLAEAKCPVLFLGDSGLGKGASAKQLSLYTSKFQAQTERPFVSVNIATLTGDLVNSELFGHEPHSFTGAGSTAKPGLFEIARNGDLFLDEIGEASLELQAKLLKIVEERKFTRVGGTQELYTDARLIFATNRNLLEMVKKGTFREDLYNRISAFAIQIPTLEERKEDIPDLIKVLLARVSTELSNRQVNYSDLPQDLVEHLGRANLPGNIRGLENELKRVVLFSPRFKNGSINFANWKTILGLVPRSIYKPSTRAISLSDLINSETDFLSDGFKSIHEFRALMDRKLFEEASKKFPTSLRPACKGSWA